MAFTDRDVDDILEGAGDVQLPAALVPIPRDPADCIRWPPTLALEIALKIASAKDTCEAYGITRDQWNVIRANDAFRSEVVAQSENLRKEGAAFRARAGLQAVEYLKRSWEMVHDKSGIVPPSVQAQLMMFTTRAAGLDYSKIQEGTAKAGVGGFVINIKM